MSLFRAFGAAALLMSTLISACGGSKSDGLGSSEPCPNDRVGGLQDRVYFGVNLDWERDSPSAYSERLGRGPSVYVLFARFPLEGQASEYVSTVVDAVAKEGGMLMLTLEPHAGLSTVTEANAAALAGQIASFNDRGVPIFLRFGHEMNGSWYPWSQQPGEYVTAFRLISAAIHRRAPSAAMVWAPNYGGGYPFSGGKYEAPPGTQAFALMDTNADGQISVKDDPYAPFYPGSDAVDWVGMSLYHWGNAYPWGENELPEPGKFVSQLRGEYTGANGDDSPLPDFYETYGRQNGKPVAITETAAFFAPTAGGQDETQIKQSWWAQVFDKDLSMQLPQVKMINWFEWRKFESEVGAEVDWRATAKPSLLALFKDALQDYLAFAEDLPDCR